MVVMRAIRASKPKVSDAERFWPSVQKRSEGCWLWTAGRIGNGYGIFRRKLVHRVSWTLTNGPIPEGMFVCHHCDTPLCVNPAHLFLGTHQDNMRDMRQKGRAQHANALKTHCKYGHEFTPENTGTWFKGKRRCKTCKAALTKRWVATSGYNEKRQARRAARKMVG